MAECKTTPVPHITETMIDGTLYIVEAKVSENAKETAYDKVKRLILSNLKLSERSKIF